MVWVCEFCNNNNADGVEVCEICGHPKTVKATPVSDSSKRTATRSAARSKSSSASRSTRSSASSGASKTAARSSSSSGTGTTAASSTASSSTSKYTSGYTPFAASTGSSETAGSMYSKSAGSTSTSGSHAARATSSGVSGSGKTAYSYGSGKYDTSKSSAYSSSKADADAGYGLYKGMMTRYKRLHRIVCFLLLALSFAFGQAIQYAYYNDGGYVPVLTELIHTYSLEWIGVDGYLKFSLIINAVSVVLAFYVASYYLKRGKYIPAYLVVVPFAFTLGIVPSVVAVFAFALLIILSICKSKWLAPFLITLFIMLNAFAFRLIALVLNLI